LWIPEVRVKSSRTTIRAPVCCRSESRSSIPSRKKEANRGNLE
jgi:hypothetical protein